MKAGEVLDDASIRSYLHRLIGDQGIELLEKFPEEGEYSDEELAEKTGINLNTVRHSLYALYEKRLAEYRRIKNTETGWLTYLWKIRLENIHSALQEEMAMFLEKLEARERYEEENDFYRCRTCGIFTFNDVVDIDFVCPSCSQPVEHFDNEVLLHALKRRIADVQACLGHE